MTNKSEIQKVYIAFFSRPADPLGRDWWVEKIMAAGGDMAAVINAFSFSQEYREMYGGLSNAEVVNQLYRNLFGRDAEEDGLKFWVDALDKGIVNIGNVAYTMIQGAQNNDAKVVTNKVEVAETFTTALDTEAKIKAYAGTPAAKIAREFLATVRHTPESLEKAKSVVPDKVVEIIGGPGRPGGGAPGGGGGPGGPTGQTYTLTTGTDTIPGATTDDAINALFAGDGTDTLTAGDSIDGGDGTDTLNLTITGPLTATVTNAVTVTKVETVNLNAGNTAFEADLSDPTKWTDVQTVNVTNTNTSTVTLGTATAYTGGAGRDVVTVGATTKAIHLGGGDDTAIVSVAVGTGGSINGGAGTADTLSMSAADAATLSATAAFETGVSGFERVAVGAVGATTAIDMANLDDINHLSVAGVAAGGLAVTNLASGGTLELTAAVAANSSVAVK
ncbi:MAG TPA: DUF4214 domain-containing protein, partial [Azospirillaceae bacterium]|nr:DUF4214 domain-containing protein [Azospirillaceae bacterium]